MSYVASTRPPVTLTEGEQARLLRITGDHKDGFRDHVIFALALGTALREFEIAALNVGDILTARNGRGVVKRRVTLRVFKHRRGTSPADQTVFLPDNLVYKIRKFARWKRDKGEGLKPDDPLFVSRQRSRISVRTLRRALGVWQERADFDRRFTFHHLRHTALTNIYRSTGDIRLVQRVGRHKNINTTTIYASPSDEDIIRAVRGLPC